MLSEKINQMQYQRVQDLRGDSDEDVGPKAPADLVQDKPGAEFLETTMGLISADKKDTYSGPSRELEDELTRMFSGAANKRQKTAH